LLYLRLNRDDIGSGYKIFAKFCESAFPIPSSGQFLSKLVIYKTITPMGRMSHYAVISNNGYPKIEQALMYPSNLQRIWVWQNA